MKRGGIENIPDKDWERMSTEASICMRRLNSILKVDPDYHLSDDKLVSSSCRHVLVNLSTSLRGVGSIYDVRDVESYHLSVIAIGALNKYFYLLDNFPDFAKKELNSGLGAFPNVLHSELTASEMVEQMFSLLTDKNI
jgi:hypothetical protein